MIQVGDNVNPTGIPINEWRHRIGYFTPEGGGLTEILEEF